MKKLTASLSLLFLTGIVWAQQPTSPTKRATTPEALKAEIEALKPVNHVWRAISWKTCPLDALREARERKQPVIAWVFLGIPSDERC